MALGDRIRDLRMARGLKAYELARMIGIKPPSLSLIETGQTRTLKASTVLRLAEVFGVDPQWLATGKGSMVRVAAHDVDEAEVLAIARNLSAPNRGAWLAAGRSLLASQPASAGDPFPAAKSKRRV